MSAMLQGIAGADTANYNAQVADNDAVMAMRDTAAAEARIRADARAAAGEAIAAQGASGLQIGTGSMLDVLRENATNAALDELTIRARGRNQANAFRAEAGLQRATAKNSFAAGLIGTAEQAAMAYAGGGFGGGKSAAPASMNAGGGASGWSPLATGGGRRWR